MNLSYAFSWQKRAVSLAHYGVTPLIKSGLYIKGCFWCTLKGMKWAIACAEVILLLRSVFIYHSMQISMIFDLDYMRVALSHSILCALLMLQPSKEERVCDELAFHLLTVTVF